MTFCGLRDRLYPDRKPMGYPFDRNHSSNMLSDFVSAHSNMAMETIGVKFSNTIVNKQ